MGDVELSLMKGLLEMDYRRRLNAHEALMHPYFDDIREPEYTNDDILQKPLITSNPNRALSPDALSYGNT